MKKLKLSSDEIKDVASGFGSCIASDHITVDGHEVGLMYREDPDDKTDSGWRFLSGDEDEAYSDNEDNFDCYDINVIANYDKDIVAFLKAPIGAEYERVEPNDPLTEVVE